MHEATPQIVDQSPIFHEEKIEVQDVVRGLLHILKISDRAAIIDKSQTQTDWSAVISEFQIKLGYQVLEYDQIDNTSEIASSKNPKVVVNNYVSQEKETEFGRQATLRSQTNMGEISSLIVLANTPPARRVFDSDYPWANGPVDARTYWAIEKDADRLMIKKHRLNRIPNRELDKFEEVDEVVATTEIK